MFDADVVIGYLGRTDPHHEEAVRRVARARDSGTKRLLSAITYAELLVGPLRAAGHAGAATVEAMLDRLSIDTVPADKDLARRAGEIRSDSKLKFPDAFAVATAVDAAERGHADVRIESFDEAVVKAYASWT